MSLTYEEFRAFVAQRFGGVLLAGTHPLNHAACALEAWSQAEGKIWTDDPSVLKLPDLRPLTVHVQSAAFQ